MTPTDDHLRLIACRLHRGGNPEGAALFLGVEWDDERDLPRLQEVGEVFRCAECFRWEDASLGDGISQCERCAERAEGDA